MAQPQTLLPVDPAESPTPPRREGGLESPAGRAVRAGRAGRWGDGPTSPSPQASSRQALAHVRWSAHTLWEPGSTSLLATVVLGVSVRWPGCRVLFCSRRAPTPPRSMSCSQRRAKDAAQAQRMAPAGGSGPQRRLNAARRGAAAHSWGRAAAQSPRAEAQPRHMPGRCWCMSVGHEPSAAARRAPRWADCTRDAARCAPVPAGRPVPAFAHTRSALVAGGAAAK